MKGLYGTGLNKFAIDHNKQAANTEPEATAIHDGDYQLTKNEFSSLGRGKYSGTAIYVTHVFCL